jgi:hypothetical protein
LPITVGIEAVREFEKPLLGAISLPSALIAAIPLLYAAILNFELFFKHKKVTMKQVNISIEGMEAFIKFCKMAELNIQQQYVDNLQQNACVSFLVNGIFDNSLEDAEEKYLIHNNKIVSIYGIFDNTKHGLTYLFEVKEKFLNNKTSEIKKMSELYEQLEALSK